MVRRENNVGLFWGGDEFIGSVHYRSVTLLVGLVTMIMIMMDYFSGSIVWVFGTIAGNSNYELFLYQALFYISLYKIFAPCNLLGVSYDMYNHFSSSYNGNFIHRICLLLYCRILEHYNNAENESNHVFQIVDHDRDDLVSWPVYKAQLLGLDPGKYERENSTSELFFCVSF